MSLADLYRPLALSEMVGQTSSVLQIKGMFSSKNIANSLLISGPTGSGKTTLARIIARMANDLPHDTVKLMDTEEINGAEARGIDDVRQLLKVAKFAPKRNFRVFILDEIHQWTPQAKQAFLKILEEPPKKTIFILCTNEPEKLPDAIVGRCQRINLVPVSIQDCTKFLNSVVEKEGLLISEESVAQIAQHTQGYPRNALQALEAVNNFLAGGGEETDAEGILSAVEQVVQLPPTDYIYRYLLSIYKGKYTTALRIASMVENVPYFISCTMDIHEQAMFSLLSPKLLEPYSLRWADMLKNKGVSKKSIDIEIFSDMLNEMVKAAERVNNRVIEGKHILISLTSNLVTLVKRNKRSIAEYHDNF